MVRRWVRVRLAALGVSVVGGWLLVMVGAALPNSAGATSFQHLALAVATCVAAVVTLLAARRRPSRRAWLLLGLGLSGYAAGFVIQFWVTAGEHGGPGGLGRVPSSGV